MMTLRSAPGAHPGECQFRVRLAMRAAQDPAAALVGEGLRQGGQDQLRRTRLLGRGHAAA